MISLLLLAPQGSVAPQGSAYRTVAFFETRQVAGRELACLKPV